jgi:hypothetical protein
MIILILIAVTAILFPVHGSLPVTAREYPLMHYTKLISEEHFTAGRPLVIALRLAEDSTNKEVGYLIEELNTSGRWPILVFNVSCEMNRNMYTEIHKYGSYIILISGPCEEAEQFHSCFRKQVLALSVGKLSVSRNSSARFIVPVMT